MEIDMQQLVAALKPYFDQLRIDVNAEISQLRSEMTERFAQVDRTLETMAGRIEARFDSIEEDIYRTKTVLTKVASDVASLKTDRDDILRRSANHAESLLDHDRRLTRLEKKTA